MNPLIVIPARGTSKGIPLKNFKSFCGRPLIDWTLDVAEALGAPYVVTTDAAGKPFVETALHDRTPEALITSTRHSDTAAMIDIVQEVTDQVPGDPVILLQPTSPCRFPRDVRYAFEELEMNMDASAICSVAAIPRTHSPGYACHLTGDGHLLTPPATRRQDVEQMFTRTGDFYITKRDTLYNHNSFYGETCLPYLLTNMSVKLDEPGDWQMGEILAPYIDPMRFGDV